MHIKTMHILVLFFIFFKNLICPVSTDLWMNAWKTDTDQKQTDLSIPTANKRIFPFIQWIIHVVNSLLQGMVMTAHLGHYFKRREELVEFMN